MTQYTSTFLSMFSMELIVFLISFILLALVVQKVGNKLKKIDSTYNLPKGPRKLPIIGNLHNLISSQVHQKLRDLAREYGPLMHLQLGEVSTIVISSPDYAREVMKTHDINFAIRPKVAASDIVGYNSTGIVLAPYGNYWRELRKICTLELFSLKRVNSYRPIREEELSNLVKWIVSQNGSTINLTQAVISSVYTIVSKAAFGKKCKDQEKFILAVKELLKIGGGFDLADLFPSITWLHYFTGLRPKLERVHRQLDEIMENIINEHKEAKSKDKYDQEGEPDEDLVDVLIKYEDGNNKETHDINFAIRPKVAASDIVGYNSTGIVLAPYGNYWRELRKICTLELFSLKRVNSYRPIREEELSNLVKWIVSQNGSTINLTQAIITSVYTIVSKAAFGKKCKDQEKFISAVKELLKIGGGFDLADLFPSITWLHYFTGLRPKLERVHRQLDEIMENIINEHKEAKSKDKYDQEGEPDEDLVDVLIKYEDGNNKEFILSADNIKAIILDIFGAGGETSANTIDWAMVEMVRNPRIMKIAQAEVRELFKMKGKVDERVINELNYLKLVVKETLRLHPPVPLLLPRECGQACDINGYHIPIKTKVIVNALAISTDPNYWTEPEKFYPERFIDSTADYKGNNFEYIPFGAGRRICPGSIFGLRSVELTLATLLFHFDWKLPNGIKSEELDMTEEFGVTMRRKDDLLLFPFSVM